MGKKINTSKAEIETEIEVEVKPKPQHNKTGPVPEEEREKRDMQAVTMVKLGYNRSEIAQKLGIHPNTVSRIRDKYSNVLKELDEVDVFREIKADLFEAAQAGMLKSMLSDDKLSKASTKDLAVSIGVLYDKNRLENNLSTSNNSNTSQVTFVNTATSYKED